MSGRAAGLVVIGLAIGALAGCGRYYYGKSDATSEQFQRDSAACAREVGAGGGGASESAIQRMYRLCLYGLEWVRDKHRRQVPEGWYRGLE
jgi:hypothetical protein